MLDTEISFLHQVIKKFNFATLISQHDGTLNISHVPVMLDPQQGTYGTLSWHVSKQNPHAKLLDDETVLLVFHGPHAYISPKWYISFPNVPTWNYVVVYAYGIPKIINQDQLENDLSLLMLQHEGHSNYMMPDGYKLRLMDHIVGFNMEIQRLENIFKLGQNRSNEDKNSMLTALKDSQSGHELGKFMEKFFSNDLELC